MLTNYNNTVLYIGVTNNLIRRVYEHKNKLLKGFTERYNVTKLVYFEMYYDIHTAIAREKILKNLVRRKKEKLVNEANSQWDDLYESLLD